MGNGVGPYWFKPWQRKLLTDFSLLFFDEASWDKHDEGYQFQKYDRKTCDLRFLQAMLRDASRKTKIWRMLGCTILAWLYWFIVRLTGKKSWNQATDVKTLKQR